MLETLGVSEEEQVKARDLLNSFGMSESISGASGSWFELSVDDPYEEISAQSGSRFSGNYTFSDFINNLASNVADKVRLEQEVFQII